MSKYESILGTVGQTPIVKVKKLSPQGVDLYVKLEAFNPMGSVKDRLALGVIEAAEASGALKPGQTVVEATSGNTGIGLAMVCAQKGYPLVVTMAENFSVERRKMMRFLGAKVILTPAAQKGSGMLAKAVELAEKHGWFLCRQFENEANADIHSKTTAREILADFDGQRLDYWVTGYGTGGTLKGVARVLKAERPDVKVAVCEPDNSQLLGSGIAQLRTRDGAPADSHPNFRPHLMQGWTPDFISRLTEDTINEKWIDQVLPIDGNDAIQCARDLAQKEGIFTGISGGATFAGALNLAKTLPEGSVVLCMLPDTGERYLTTPLFENIQTEMTDDEVALSRSTPGYRFDIATPAPVTDEEETTPQVTDKAKQFLADVRNDPTQPVVMFALEWCEFCWSVRKMFAELGIAYRSIDLDSVKYQQGNFGGDIRLALAEQTQCKTIPQIFIQGEFVGGATDLFDAYNAGDLQTKLSAAGVEFDRSKTVDPYSFLPKWLQPRSQE